MQGAETGQKIGQEIGRGDGGGPEGDRVVALSPACEQTILRRQDLHGIVVELAAMRRDGKGFGGAEEETLLQLLLQLADVGRDGGLRGIELGGGLCERAAVGHGDEGTELLKVHGAPPWSGC